MERDTLTTTDRKLCEVIAEAYRKGFTVQSDYARMHADYVAMAASLGLLSTKLFDNVFSREWRPTIRGLAFANEVMDLGLREEDDED
jgi:hypothetical protein